MYCTKCGTELDDNAKFCGECGEHIEKIEEKHTVFCTKCGTSHENNEKFCGECGEKLRTFESPVEIKKAEVFDNAISKNIINIPRDNSFYPNHGNYQSAYRDNKKKSKVPVILLCVFLFVIFGTLIFLTKDKLFDTKNGKRTIMIYMIGSNLESKYFSATRDISEMRNSNADFENLNILIYTGGSKSWHSFDIPNDKHAIYKVTADGLEQLEVYDNSNNMTDPDNLAFFLEYGYNNYKADNYGLILWDHGGGPIYGYGVDEYHSNDSLTIEKMKRALKDSPFSGENKLEFIGFDACLMGSVEVAYSLSEYADYMIASEESEPGGGWDYSFLGEISASTDAQTLGKLIVDFYDDCYAKNRFINGTSMAVLKLNKIDNVEKYLNELFSKIDNNLDIDYSSISRSRRTSKSFGREADEEYTYDLIDLVDLIDKLPSKYSDAANNLKNAISDFVVYQKTDLENTNGVSIYFPYEYKKYLKEIIMEYYTFDFAKDYYNFISNFAKKLTGVRRNNFDLSRSSIKALGESSIIIELPKEVIDNYSSAEYVLFIKNSDNTYTPIYRGTDINVAENSMSTTVSRKILVAKDQQGNELVLTAIESERGKNYIKYLVPATLNKFGESYEYTIENVYIEVIVDSDNPEGYIGRVIPMNEEGVNHPVKTELDINDYDIININSFSYNIFDSTGAYKKDWDVSNNITSLQLSTLEEFTIEFRDLDISNTYYALFKIEDSQGNITYSNPVLVNNK